VYFSNQNKGDAEVTNMVYSNVMRLRTRPHFRNSLFVVFIEANSSWKEADRYGSRFMRPEFGAVYIESRDSSGKGRFGVWNTDAEKQNFADVIQYSFMSEAVTYAQDFNSVNGDKFKETFERQADVFRREFKALTNPVFQKPKEIITGKGRDQKDDAIIAYGLCLDGWRTLMRRRCPRFAEACRQQGIVTQFYEDD